MSLDVDLYIGDECVFSYNITHNLNKMAEAAGIYKEVWRPDEIGVSTAAEIQDTLYKGIKDLYANPTKYREYNPENGWGNYEGFCKFIEAYHIACMKYPEARIEVSR